MRRCALLLSAAALVLSACGSSTQGPTTWIDQPLDGAHVALGTLTLMAHASDEHGVAIIEFYLAQDLLASLPAGGGRMGQASTEWSPPAPGVYEIIARAVDGPGNYGEQARAVITVGELPDTATPTPAPAEFATASPSPEPASTLTLTLTLAPTLGRPSLTLTQNANCRTGPATAYESIDVLMSGANVPIEGKNQEGNWFWVLRPAGGAHCWVSIVAGQVAGDLAGVPVVSAPPLPATPTQPDTTPPEITAYGASPASLQKAGCGEPSTTLVSATVTDSGGVSRVAARVLGFAEFDLSPAGGQVYQGWVGPFPDTGEYSILILALDGAGNSAQAGPVAVTVVCIG